MYTGIVIQIFHKYLIALIEQKQYCVKITTNFSQKIYIGDQIVFFPDNNNNYWIEKILPRENLIFRPKIANIKSIIIVYSLEQKRRIYNDLFWWIMQYEQQNLNVVVLFTKWDIATKKQKENFELNCEFLNHLEIKFLNYRKDPKYINYFNFKQMYALVGLSGAGKSTFINYINPKYLILTKDVNQKNKYGKHTTTTIKIYSINNFFLIDTPGFSNIINIHNKFECSGAWKKWKTIQLNKCKFKNCLHNECAHECAIYNLINKEIHLDFFKMYLSFLKKIN